MADADAVFDHDAEELQDGPRLVILLVHAMHVPASMEGAHLRQRASASGSERRRPPRSHQDALTHSSSVLDLVPHARGDGGADETVDRAVQTGDFLDQA